MRRLCAISVLIAASACAHAKPAAVEGTHASERLAAADRLVDAGCYDCLVAAYREYDALRADPAVARIAEVRTISAAALVALRERELGMAEGGYLDRARDALAQAAGAPAGLATVLEVIDLLPSSSLGPGRPADSDIELTRALKLRANRDVYTTALRDLAPGDPLSAYTWASFRCAAGAGRDSPPEETFDVVAAFATRPLLEFRRATCQDLNKERLATLLARDPRYLEANYLLGRIAVGRRDLDGAQKSFEQAYAWHPRWPALTRALANIALTAEEFDAAARYYDETLALDPLAADARLGKVRALTYLTRHAEAIAVADEMLASHWFIGDARY